MNLRSLQSVIQSISDTFPQEASIAIADRSHFIYYQPSRRIDLKIKPGDEIAEGTLTGLALQRKTRMSQYLEANPFGVSYYAISTPILNEDLIDGCFTLIYPSPVETSVPRHEFLVGKTESSWVPIRLSDIYVIASEAGKTVLYTAAGRYFNKFSLAELERMLPKEKFIRCHRSFLVNVNEIAEIHPDFHSTFTLALKHDKNLRVPVSQKFSGQFRRFMGF